MRDCGTAVPTPRLPEPPARPGELEGWLRASLQQQFDAVAREAVPESLLRLLPLS